MDHRVGDFLTGDITANLHARDAEAAITHCISLLPIRFCIDISIFTEEREESSRGNGHFKRTG